MFGVLLLVVLSGILLQDTWRWNVRAILFLKGKGDTIPITVSDCNHFMLIGAAAGKRGDISGQRQVWEHALGCSRNNISILMSVMPLDQDMALLATQLYPDSSASWFWLGESIAPSDYLSARQAYLHSIKLSPNDGLTWCRLGTSYRQSGEFEKSTDAFLNCCHNGDPGSNGCYGAGLLMEGLGDPQQAIEYYRLSQWEGALKRADELEHQLHP